MKGPDVVLFFDSDTEESEVAAMITKVKKQLQAIRSDRRPKMSSLLMPSELDSDGMDPAPGSSSSSDEMAFPQSVALPTNISKKGRKLNARLERLLKVKKRKKSKDVEKTETRFVKGRAKVGETCESCDLDGSSFIKNTDKSDELDSNYTDSNISSCKDVNRKSKGITKKRKQDESSCNGSQVKKAKLEVEFSSSSTSRYEKSKYVALDCEFLGVGPHKRSALGRCSIVDFDGRVLLDIYSQPDEQITDYRTPWSGLRPHHMRHAVPFENAQNQVRRIIEDKIIVGHAVHNDLAILRINKTKNLIRDTSKYAPLRTLANLPTKGGISLKALSLHILGSKIQVNTHCSVEDARATMALFRQVWEQWEEDRASNCDSVSTNDHSKADDTEVESYLDDAYWPSDV